MYLSRLALNPRHPWARRDAGNCHDLHRTLLSAFPQAAPVGPGEPEARAQFGLLYRLEVDRRSGAPVVIAQSRTEPDWSRLPKDYFAPQSGGANPDCKAVAARYAAITAGQTLRFRLRANPTKRSATKRRSSGRAGGQGDRPGPRLALISEAEQLAWLEGKAAAAGFSLVQVATSAGARDMLAPDVRIDPVAQQKGIRATANGERMPLVFGAALFEGVLRVGDAARLREAIALGIGSGKAYGFGLLSVAPV